MLEHLWCCLLSVVFSGIGFVWAHPLEVMVGVAAFLLLSMASGREVAND